MSRGIHPWCLSVLAAGLCTGCALFEDSQTKSLDLSELAEGEGYVVGTFTSVENHTEDEVSKLTEAPDIDYVAHVSVARPVASVGDALWAELQDSVSTSNQTIGVDGEKSPMLFALKMDTGTYWIKSVGIQAGNMTWSAPVRLSFDVVPGSITYIGDVLLQFDTSSGLFGLRDYDSVHANVRDDRALFDRLMTARFPGAHPTLAVGLARPGG